LIVYKTPKDQITWEKAEFRAKAVHVVEKMGKDGNVNRYLRILSAAICCEGKTEDIIFSHYLSSKAYN
jgi:hypothetical protein